MGYIMRNKKGFTLVEIIIVVAIVGILSAVATIHFIRARQMARNNICVTNLKQIQDAIQNWAIGENMDATDIPTTGDLVPRYIQSWPACPQRNQSYEPCAVDEVPQCPTDPGNHHL